MLRYTPVKAGKIITACAVLHNMCINGNAHQYLEAGGPLRNDFRRDDVPVPPPGGVDLFRQGRAARQRLVEYLQQRRHN